MVNTNNKFDFDLFVIGAGSGGVRAARMAASKGVNVAIAEVDYHDKWQRSVLGVAVVSTAQDHANSILSKVVNFVESMYLADLVDYQIEFW